MASPTSPRRKASTQAAKMKPMMTVTSEPTLSASSFCRVTITVTPTTGTRVVSRDARWTYTYANSAIVAPGTYGGTNVNNSRVTYTAAMP